MKCKGLQIKLSDGRSVAFGHVTDHPEGDGYYFVFEREATAEELQERHPSPYTEVVDGRHRIFVPTTCESTAAMYELMTKEFENPKSLARLIQSLEDKDAKREG